MIRVRDASWIMEISGTVTRKVFSVLWTTAIETDSISVPLDREKLKGINRQNLWRSLTDLEKSGVIQRGKDNRGWDMIVINPHILCPHWMSKERLTEYGFMPYKDEIAANGGGNEHPEAN